MSLPDIPFDCLLPHLEDEQIRRLWATCRQLKADIESAGCFCRYSRCRKFLPKGTDLEGRCMKHYIGRRARKFYHGYTDILYERSWVETRSTYLKIMGKKYQSLYSLELESKLDGIIKMLMDGGTYITPEGFHLKMGNTEVYHKMSDDSYYQTMEYQLMLFDDSYHRITTLMIDGKQHIMPCKISPQILMALIVGNENKLIRITKY